jgi:SAM-dependent methyltransferase
MDAETITRHTYDRIAHAYSRETAQSEVRRGIRPSLLKFASLTSPSGRVLVAGAGDGRDGLILRTRGITPLYLDYSHRMNAIAHRKDAGAMIVTADVRTLPFAAESFDGVWASMCLYHLRLNSLKSCITEIRRVLRPGGLFYFNLRPGRGQRMISHPWSFPHGGARHYTRYLPNQVISLAKGFETLRVQRFDRRLGAHLIQVWLRRPIPELIRMP